MDESGEQVMAYLGREERLETLLARAAPATRERLERALAGRELGVEDTVALLGAQGDDLRALLRTADAVREGDVGDEVTYIVNRNINFTNICFVGCRFCAFKRGRGDPGAYTHSLPELLAKVAEAVEHGATEVCIQGGINPAMDAFAYRDLLLHIKAAFPAVHIHAFSPMEIMYGARRTGMPYGPYLAMLRDAGLGSLPGTAAEILDDDVREVLSHKKVDVRTWVEIITTAHRLGIPSSATLMYGHVESAAHVARHLALIRRLQHETGGFTEFVPLRFIHEHTVLYQQGLVHPPRKGLMDLRLYAVCRLVLRGAINNIQTSWVKLGHRLAQLTLHAGCNDFGGTLMEEKISSAAGADAGEFTSVEDIRAYIIGAGRRPVERTTLYGRPGNGGAEAARAPHWR